MLLSKREKWIVEQAEGDVLDVGGDESRYTNALKQKAISLDIIDNRGERNINLDLNSFWEINHSLKKKYDTIIMGEVIEHLDNPLETIKEFCRFLKKDGKLIITTPNARSLKPTWENLEKHPEHIYTWSLTLLGRFINRTDLNIIDLGYFPSIITMFNKKRSMHLYLIATKK